MMFSIIDQKCGHWCRPKRYYLSADHDGYPSPGFQDGLIEHLLLRFARRDVQFQETTADLPHSRQVSFPLMLLIVYAIVADSVCYRQWLMIPVKSLL